MSDKLSDTSNHIKSKIEQLLINLPKKLAGKCKNCWMIHSIKLEVRFFKNFLLIDRNILQRGTKLTYFPKKINRNHVRVCL